MCTLSDSELQDRGAAWRKLWSSGLLSRERIPGGIRLRAEPGAAVALGRLVELERECCAWIDYETGDGWAVLTAPGPGEDVLATMFGPG